VIVIYFMAAAQQSPPGDLWSALAGALRDNPLLTLLGWSLAVFGAGFAARRYFQDRELDRLRTSLRETNERLESATARLQAIESGEQESKDQMKRIADCLTPDDLKKHLVSPLSHWPVEKHDLLIAGLMRQLISTPGRAWLCTPAGTSLVKVDWDEQRGACRIGSETNSQVDPIKELRELITDRETLDEVLFDVAVHGITSIAIKTGPKTLQRILIRQGPGLGWELEKQTLERVETAPNPAAPADQKAPLSGR